MTAMARTVLNEARFARAELQDGVQGSTWLRRWVTAVVLLRVVGHALDKADGKQSEHYRNAIERWWIALKASKPIPAIFWEFIDDERNQILKEFKINAGQGVTIQLHGQTMQLNSQASARSPEPTRVEAIYHYPITGGPFAGADQGHVLDLALAWWQAELDFIDEAVVQAGGIKSVGHMAIGRAG